MSASPPHENSDSARGPHHGHSISSISVSVCALS
jgi:hypothetical protein